jgi:hypothetical protein
VVAAHHLSPNQMASEPINLHDPALNR